VEGKVTGGPTFEQIVLRQAPGGSPRRHLPGGLRWLILLPGAVKGKWKSKGSWIKIMDKAKENYRVALCIKNNNCEDLEKRKIYQMLPDEEAEKEGYIRVIDESGEDYSTPGPISSWSNCPGKRKRRCSYQNNLFILFQK
jgi:hypothetical protein